MVKKLEKKPQTRGLASGFDDPDSPDLDSPFQPLNLEQPVWERTSTSRSASVPPPVPSGLSRKPQNLFVAVLQVLFATIVMFVLFIALGIGLVYLGQRQGLLPTPAAPARAVSALPTLPSLNPAPTSPAGDTVVTATPEPCADPTAWWLNVRDSWLTSVSAFSRAFYAPAVPLDDVVAAAAEARAAAEAAPFPECLRGLSATLLQAMDAQNAALAALQAVDRATAQVRASEAAALFASVLDSSWGIGVDTGADSPVSRAIPPGDCAGASEWYAAFSQQIGPFFDSVLPAVDVVNAPAITVSQAAADTRTILAAIQALTPPTCAQVPQQAAVLMLSGFADAIGATMGGRLNDAQLPAAQYAEAAVTLDAWLRWLQLTIA